MRLRFEFAIRAGPFGPALYALIITFSLFFFITIWLSGNKQHPTATCAVVGSACERVRSLALTCCFELLNPDIRSPRLKIGGFPKPDKFRGIS
jgi:hypothetical protein